MKLDLIVLERYPGFVAGYVRVSGITIESTVETLTERRNQVLGEVKARYAGQNVLDLIDVKAYRAFFKAMGADPSSYRPAPEFMLRRALDDRFPTINNLVDSCLLATVEHLVPTGVYDLEKIKGEARTTLAGEGEQFELIDGRKLTPKRGEVILKDDQKVLSAYTLGDAKAAMVTIKTTNALIVVWNAPGIDRSRVEAAVSTLATYARRYGGGHVDHTEVL